MGGGRRGSGRAAGGARRVTVSTRVSLGVAGGEGGNLFYAGDGIYTKSVEDRERATGA